MKADVNKITETILSLERGINDRWNKGDVDGALEMYSEEVTYFDPLTEMRLKGRKAVEAYFRQFFDGKLNILRNEFPNPQVIVSDGGDLAVLHYNLVNIVPDGQGGEKQGTPWNSTQVYRLIDGQWRVVHVNWSFTRHPAAMFPFSRRQPCRELRPGPGQPLSTTASTKERTMNPFTEDKVKTLLVKRTLYAGVVLTCFAWAISRTAIAQPEQNLLIPGIAAAKEIPGMKEMPDPNLTYKVIFDIGKGADKVDQINPGLETVGRIVNTLAAHGISAEHRKIAVIFYGAATDIVQNNDAFKARNAGHDNPNIAVMRAMKQAGVDLRVCGQAVQRRKIDPKTIQPEVELDLGAVFTLMNLQLRGYVRIGD